MGLEVTITCCVRIYGVLAAIKFNNQLFIKAGEISNEWTDRMLTAKAISKKLFAPESAPQNIFDLRAVKAELAGRYFPGTVTHGVDSVCYAPPS